jgi:predicted GNAT family N-acyltransferase
MNLEDLEIFLLDEDSPLETFDCGDAQLNDFLLNKAKAYQSAWLASTHLVKQADRLVAYFSLLNDKVEFDQPEERGKTLRNRFNRINKIPNAKRHWTYPAVKIGRLAVAKEYAGKGVGNRLLGTIQAIALQNESIACRFLTVDAYLPAIPFYLKNGFKYLSEEDINDKTRSLYFDLKIAGGISQTLKE